MDFKELCEKFIAKYGNEMWLDVTIDENRECLIIVFGDDPDEEIYSRAWLERALNIQEGK